MNNLPSGTVTFLFTDIEGSTKLWEKYLEAKRLSKRIVAISSRPQAMESTLCSALPWTTIDA